MNTKQRFYAELAKKVGHIVHPDLLKAGEAYLLDVMNGKFCLNYLDKKREEDYIELCLKEYTPPTIKELSEELIIACISEQEEKAKELLKAGADKNYYSKHEETTALDSAITFCSEDFINFIKNY